jgi:hypothetical protein
MRKLEALKVRGVQKEEKKIEKMSFVSWKAYFSFCYFFMTHFLLHFKDEFLSLR